MAAHNKLLVFWLLCLALVCECKETSIHWMHQTGACDDLNGQWLMKTSRKDGYDVYFDIKNQPDFISMWTPAQLKPTLLPFDVTTTWTEGDKTSFTVGKSQLIEELKSVHENEDGHCVLVFLDGTKFIKLQTVNNVHLIFMNHLDVGYNTNHNYPGSKELIPGYIVNVLNWYFQVYFPRAVRLGNELRALRQNETFIYTTHPWLVSLYLDCPSMELSGIKLQCPTEEEIETFRRAVWLGDIVWHAGPFNTEPESANPELFSYSLTLSKDLDAYFGFQKTGRTASNRDVPGWTRAAIPYLVQHNIDALSIGINPSSAPPDVPSPNVWKFDDYSIISYWHKGGYPLDPGPSPQQPGGLSRKDCQFAPGLDHVLCFAFRSDNDGPPENVQEIKNYYKILRYQFPGANIKAATFEDFTKLLLPIKNRLPVVTKEIGDTWIQGPASDPIKMSHYRTISRMRSQCLKSHECDPNDKRIKDMSRMLIKLPEHTFGLAMNFDWRNWSNADFQPWQYLEAGFVNDTKSWLSQRGFNDLAINALKDHPLAKQIKNELKNLQPYVPDFSNSIEWDNSDPIVCKNGMILEFGWDGSLIRMKDQKGREWADDENSLLKFMYRTYNTTDFNDFAEQYNYLGGAGIWKPGLDVYTKAESRFWSSHMRALMVSSSSDPCAEIYVRLIMLDAEAWWKYGSPTEYVFKYSVKNTAIDVEFMYYNKPSTRMPEALYLSFKTTPKFDHNWYLHKVGYLIDPTNVVNNGSQYVHAVDQGVAYFDANNRGLFIESLDVATVVVQTEDRDPSPFPVPLAPMKTKPTGMAFNMYNNIWETNFIYWYPYQPQDKHFKARFRLNFI